MDPCRRRRVWDYKSTWYSSGCKCLLHMSRSAPTLNFGFSLLFSLWRFLFRFFLLSSSEIQLWVSPTFNPVYVCVQSPRKTSHGTPVCHSQDSLCKKFIHSFDIFEPLWGVRYWDGTNMSDTKCWLPYSLGKTTNSSTLGLRPGIGGRRREQEPRIRSPSLGWKAGRLRLYGQGWWMWPAKTHPWSACQSHKSTLAFVVCTCFKMQWSIRESGLFHELMKPGSELSLRLCVSLSVSTHLVLTLLFNRLG